jgi:16S rRNA (adenine1518-N6/adenine1519-N6)-dimethyltransferase
MDLSNLADARAAMQLAGLRPQKGLGQHFLIDSQALQTIVAAGELSASDTVLEVGPGLGTMTKLLAEQAGRVVAVETDAALANRLEISKPANLEIIQKSITDYDLHNMGPDYKVVANLPYYITSQILRLFMENPNPPKLMVLLVQKEVAVRVVAGPGQMSILALSIQYYAVPSIVGLVGRHSFWPAPKVDSAILRLERRPKPAFEADPHKLFRLIKAGFGEKRKQLKNSLAGGLNTTVEVASQLLAAAKLPPQSRAQELTLAQWNDLYKQTIKKGLLS